MSVCRAKKSTARPTAVELGVSPLRPADRAWKAWLKLSRKNENFPATALTVTEFLEWKLFLAGWIAAQTKDADFVCSEIVGYSALRKALSLIVTRTDLAVWIAVFWGLCWLAEPVQASGNRGVGENLSALSVGPGQFVDQPFDVGSGKTFEFLSENVEGKSGAFDRHNFASHLARPAGNHERNDSFLRVVLQASGSKLGKLNEHVRKNIIVGVSDAGAFEGIHGPTIAALTLIFVQLGCVAAVLFFIFRTPVGMSSANALPGAGVRSNSCGRRFFSGQSMDVPGVVWDIDERGRLIGRPVLPGKVSGDGAGGGLCGGSAVRLFLAAICCVALFGCACPRMASHYEPSADGSRAPWHQCTLEAIQCAHKQGPDNLPLTTPVWLGARGLYRVTVPAENRTPTY